ncbi:MAG: sigma-70 family RNA polymerase sigma factor [Planctomycetia bacterium]|nr:sigma-70 family RNA polymerase sigma factor [Planctomycetia bacterium]
MAQAASNTQGQDYELRDPDVRLMLRVRDDDAAAFEELMLRYQNRVLTLLEHMVAHRHQAEDLTQDVFLRVYRARKHYVPGSKFSTWLFTIVNNVASNAKRSRARRREVNLDPGTSSGSGPVARQNLDAIAVAASGSMPSRLVVKAEMRDVIRAAVSELNDRQRMAVLLSKFEGMGYADIAKAMEMTPQAIKSLLSRARENLRGFLEPYLERGDRPASEGNGESNGA